MLKRHRVPTGVCNADAEQVSLILIVSLLMALNKFEHCSSVFIVQSLNAFLYLFNSLNAKVVIT